MSAVHNFTATDYDDALLRLVDLAVNNNVIAAAINAGGTGYTVGDILTVGGGTVVSSLVATLEVTSETALQDAEDVGWAAHELGEEIRQGIEPPRALL